MRLTWGAPIPTGFEFFRIDCSWCKRVSPSPGAFFKNKKRYVVLLEIQLDSSSIGDRRFSAERRRVARGMFERRRADSRLCSDQSFAIIIPAYNEEMRIESTVQAYCDYFKDGNVVVVANGCSDATVSIVRRLLQKFSNLRLVDIPLRVGKGGAIRAGFMACRETLVGFTDADGSTSPDQLRELFVRCSAEKTDAVIGSRWHRDSRVAKPQRGIRRVASRAFNLLVRALLGLPYCDTQCGAQVFRREVLARALATLQLSDFAFDVDLLFQLKLRGARIRECPIEWNDAAGSTVHLWGSSRAMALGVLRIRVLHSILGWAPFVDLIARDSVIPVQRPTSVLAFSDRRGRETADASLLDYLMQLGELQANGIRVTWAPVYRSPLRAIAQLTWYAIEGHRLYDAIVTLSPSRTNIITALSRKPKYSISETVDVASIAQSLTARRFRESHDREFSLDGNSLLFRSRDLAGGFRVLPLRFVGTDAADVGSEAIAEIG